MERDPGPLTRPRPGLSETARRVRVLIVDDSLTVRTAFKRTIEQTDDLVVTALAGSAEVAISLLKTERVDVVLLDLDMPGMGGLQAMPQMLEMAAGARILVVSSLTEAGAEHTLAALSMGAADTMLKPRSGEFGPAYRQALADRIRALGRARGAQSGSKRHQQPVLKRRSRKRPRMVAIGASTGGIHALGLLLSNLTPRFDLPILVTQHLPHSFMPVFARQLEISSARETRIAEDGAMLRNGTITIAPGDAHARVKETASGLAIELSNESAPSGCMPSVDPMLESAAQACDGEVLAVILSGMGRDGALGAQTLCEAGGTVFVQDADSSAVWGMPGAVASMGLASAILPPAHLAQKIAAFVEASHGNE